MQCNNNPELPEFFVLVALKAIYDGKSETFIHFSIGFLFLLFSLFNSFFF